MIFTENLDHNPQAVTLEKLPDGTAWLYLRKDAHEVRTEAPEGEQGGYFVGVHHGSLQVGLRLCRGNRGKHHGGG